MDAQYAHVGHPRSISLTILPLSLEASEWPTSPRQLSPKHLSNFPDALDTPLPPSAPESEHDDLLRDPEKEPPPEITTVDIPEELRIPLPPSPQESEHRDEHTGRGDGDTGVPEAGKRHSWSASVIEDVFQGQSSSNAGPGDLAWLANPTESFSALMQLTHRVVNGRNQVLGLRAQIISLLSSCAAKHRLGPVQSSLYKRMVEAFRTEKQSSFASLLTRSEQIQAGYSEPSGYGGYGVPDDPHDQKARFTSRDPWLYGLPLRSQTVILRFLNSMRNEPQFLAERLSCLKTSQLKALARPHRHLAANETVMEPSSGLHRFHPKNLQRLHPRALEIPSLEELSRDPLRLLITSLFDTSNPSGSRERARQLDVWSSVCARIIEDHRPGSDEICLAVLDIFAELSQWALRPKLELFLMDLMHTGASIVDPAIPGHGADFAASSYMPSQSDGISSEYFEIAVRSLLDLVTSIPAGAGVPPHVLTLIRATIAKLNSPETKLKAKRFFISKWFCTSFLADALLFPERHQMLMKTHVSPHVRQKLFRELAFKMQRAVIGFFTLRDAIPCLHSTDCAVQKLATLFDPQPEDLQKLSLNSLTGTDRLFTVLHAEDVLSIAKALYPDDSPDPSLSSAVGGRFSSASSVTGSSTLTAGADESRLGAISAFTPSISGTSVTSNTFSNDFFLRSEDRPEPSNLAPTGTPLRSRPNTASGLSPNAPKVPIQEFLPDLWKLCSSRKSSSSQPQHPDAALFYVDERDGHLSFRASRSARGDIDIQSAPRDLAYDSLTSTTRSIIIQALSKCSLSQVSLGIRDSANPNSIFTSLKAAFKQCLAASQASHDFSSAHFWFQASRALSSTDKEFDAIVLPDMVARLKNSMLDSISAISLYQDWLFSLQTWHRAQSEQARQTKLSVAILQAKMWYVTDVRHSSPYERMANVAGALRSMRDLPPAKRQSVTAWAKQRFRVSFGQERTQAQFLELMSAPKTCGGPNKLTDEQIELTSRWLTQESIENFCRGEERMHRFCLEIQKCASSLVGKSMLESPVLWSSSLFQKKQSFATDLGSAEGVSSRQGSFRLPQRINGQPPFEPLNLTRDPPLFPANRGLGFSVDKPEPHTVASQPAGGSMQGFKHGLDIDFRLPPSPVSPEMNSQSQGQAEGRLGLATEELRQTVVALLISDLGYDLWNQGSETDIWFNGEKSPVAAASQNLTKQSPAKTREDSSTVPSARSGSKSRVSVASEPTLQDREARTRASHEALNSADRDDWPTFDFAEGYEKLLKTFKLSSDPLQKLQALYELSLLAECQCSASYTLDKPSAKTKPLERSVFGKLSSRGQQMSRIRLTRLEEVVANCEERRQASIKTYNEHSAQPDTSLSAWNGLASAYDISSALMLVSALFLDHQYRPTTLFRDLQLIASFVPSSVLDRTPRGTVFWTVGLVAMSLKAETCKIMTDQANEIVRYHLDSSNRREPVRTDRKTERIVKSRESAQMQAEELSSTQLADAARLYMLSALEGEPAAARELGLFYLTHPELVRYVMLPLSKPMEVAKSASLLGAAADRRGRDHGHGVLDPQTFAIAYHWMEFAANAGDADAQTFLRENSDLRKGL